MAPGVAEMNGPVVGRVLPELAPEAIVSPVTAKTTPDLFSLAGGTTVITGGARGLGLCIANAVLEAGGHVACLDILEQPDMEEWPLVAAFAKSKGLGLTYHRCDVADEVNVEQTIVVVDTQAQLANAPISGMVLCAAIAQPLPAIGYPALDFERVMRINVVGTFLPAKYGARIMRSRATKGSIVMIASMSGQIANRGLTMTAYNSSKAAVQQMCRSVAQEWGQWGIRVNTLSPGYIRTKMTDLLLARDPEVEKIWLRGALLGRLGAPEDFKAPAVFLLGPGSAFMTGADLRVDGGHCASA